MLRLTLGFLLLINAYSYADNFSDAVAAYDRRDYSEAFRLFSELEELGHVDSANNLATLYQTGQGTPRNYVKAADLYLKAAKEGHIDAAFNYSTLSRLGVGVHRNMADAYAWAVIAARHGASDLVAYRDVLAIKITPEELAAGSGIAEKILEAFTQHEHSVGWLLPNNVRIASRETTIPQSMDRVERMSSLGDVSVIRSEDIQKITEENENVYSAPSYRAVFTTLPLALNRYSYTMYRPLLSSSRHSTQQILRPRRMVGERSVPVVVAMEIDGSLLPLIQSLSTTYQLHINDVVRAVQTMNPGVFEPDLPLRLKNPETRLKIPSYSQVESL